MKDDSEKKARKKRELRKILKSIFGTVQYTPPEIYRVFYKKKALQAKEYLTKEKRAFLSRIARKVLLFSAIAIGLVVVGKLGLFFYEKSKPEQIRVNYNVFAPKEHVLDSDPIPKLTMKFGGSASKKEDMGKVIGQGISIKPEIPGEWTWDTDSTILFQPSEKWAVGKKYSVSLDRDLFPSHITIPDLDFDFTTPGIKANLGRTEFYIDPTDANIKRVLSSIRFNYPIDGESLEGKIRIYPELDNPSLSRLKDSYEFELIYNEDFTEVSIVSEPIGMSTIDYSMKVELQKGVLIKDKSVSTSKESFQRVSIPGISSFVKINSLSFELIKNDRQVFDQIITLSTKGEASVEDLMKNIEVWMLPKDRPELPGIKGEEDFRWNSTDLVVDEVLELSQRVELEPLPVEKEYNSFNSFKIDVTPGRYLYVKIKEGAPFYGGYFLAKGHERILMVKNYPKELEIISEGNVLSLTGDKQISLYARGISEVRFKIQRILPDDINHLVSQSNGDITNLYFDNYNFNASHISKSYNETLSLNMTNMRDVQYFSLDMSKYLNTIPEENLRYGLFIVDVGEYRNGYTSSMDKRLIMVSDLGMLVKTNSDGSKDVFIQSIATGSPVPSCQVQILGLNGIALSNKVTDAQGHVTFPVMDFSKDENKPTAFVVSKGNDLSFLPYRTSGRYLDYSGFDVGGVHGASDKGKLTTQVFSDRGLYRPGDQINGALIIKAGDWDSPIGGTPLLLTVTDPKGQNIHEESIILSNEGFNDFHFKTEDYSPTGEYKISLYLVRENKSDLYLGGENVKVEEFQPDRLKVSTSFSRVSQGWISPENLEAFVSVRNLYGAPAVGNKVTGSFSLVPASLYFPQYREYRFLQPQRTTLTHNEELNPLNTDDEGSVTFTLPLDKFEKATYRMRLSVNAYEKDGGRNVASQGTALISPLESLVGYKADGDLGYIQKGEVRQVELIAINSELEQIDLSGAKISLGQLRYVSTLVKQPNGVYKYQSIAQDNPLSVEPLSIASGGTVLSLDSSEPGNYYLEVLDKDDNLINKISYAIVGESNLSRSLNRSAELEIKLDKADYDLGETVEVSISAPYPGSGLITIEQDKVYTYKWFTSDSTSTIQTIDLPRSGLEGNGYVTVSYIRSLDSKEIFMSPLSYGSVPFSLSKEGQTQQITLDYPSLVKPGQELPITYTSDKPGKIIIYGVDEGILQISKYKLPDPLSHFLRKRALEVKTAQLLDLILPEYSVVKSFSEMGGGQGAGLLAANLNPFKRKNLAPVVYWSGVLDSGPEARTTTYTVPDYFNGSLRLMAVCVSKDALGSTQSFTFVRDTFIIQPTAPLAVTPGDSFILKATIANNMAGSGEEALLNIRLEADDALELESTTLSVVIPEGKDKVVSFPVSVVNKLGAANIKIIVEHGGETSQMTHSLSVRPAVPYRTTLITGVRKKGDVTIDIEREMYEEFRTLNLSASYLPLGMANGLNFYLEKYPYTCTEQLISGSFPKLYTNFIKNLNISPEERDQSHANTLAILQARQKSDGAFGMWTVKSNSVDLIDLYAYHYLLEAHNKGLYVPQSLVSRAASRAKKLADEEGTSLSSLRIRAYAVFLLTSSGETTTRYLETLRKDLKEYDGEWETDLTGLYMASSYSLLQMNLQASPILRKVRVAVRRDYFDDGYHDNLSFFSQYLITLSRYAPQRLKDASAEVLEGMAEELAGNNYTTFSASMALIGIQSYMDSVEGLADQPLEVNQIINEDTSHPLAMEGETLKSADFSDDTKSLEINNLLAQSVFYQITQGGFDRETPLEEVSHNIEIFRDFIDENGKVVTEMELGESYQVRIRVRSLSKDRITNIAVVDLLPACIEPVIETIRSKGNLSITNKKFSTDYLDIREDRLVLYGTVDSDLREYIYPVTAVYAGEFIVPPLFAEHMYDHDTWALQLAGELKVVE